MKLRLIGIAVLLATSAVAADWPKIVVAPGAWAVCGTTPGIVCDPTIPEMWSVWVRSTERADVVAYMVTLKYVDQENNPGQVSLIIRRVPNQSGYCGEWVTLGRVTITSKEVTPLRAAGATESF